MIAVICGPTAVGKTKYAIEFAKAVNGEIVSADSMQLYKYMDIGSAKPTAEEQAQVPHHLVDEIDPREPFSVAEYQKRAKAAIFEIQGRGKTPVISGGTGLYINSLIYDMDFSAPPKEHSSRAKLEKEGAEKGGEYLHRILQEKSPEAAARIHPNNTKKIIRAIEIADENNGVVRDFSQAFTPTKDYSCCIMGLNRPRQELYSRIDLRVEELVKNGLFEEVKSLLNMGLTEENISMKGIGYKEIMGFFNGEYDREQAVYLVKRNTRHYAKRQLTWLRRLEKLRWFDISAYYRETHNEKNTNNKAHCEEKHNKETYNYESRLLDDMIEYFRFLSEREEL